MLRLSVGALRTRWQLFAGAVVAVALGVGLVQSGLQMLAATDRPTLPAGMSAYQRAQVREGYVGAATLLEMSVMLAVFLSVFIVSTTFGFMTVQRRREFTLARMAGLTRGQVVTVALVESGTVVVVGVLLGSLVAAAALAGIAAGPYGLAALAIPWRLLGLIFGSALIVVGLAAALTAYRATSRRLGTY
jgi:ABC-type antimicrobial peptide transport system permease subunit